MKLRILALLFITLSAQAVTETVTINFESRRTPDLSVYQANLKTYKWTMYNGSSVVNLTEYTPVMYWAYSNNAPGVVTASVSIVSATGGTFTATFSTADLNAASGTYIYGVGLLSDAGVTIARQGRFEIIDDPYAGGADAITFRTNVNWQTINWIGLPTFATGEFLRIESDGIFTQMYAAGLNLSSMTNAPGEL